MFEKKTETGLTRFQQKQTRQEMLTQFKLDFNTLFAQKLYRYPTSNTLNLSAPLINAVLY
jgi:hypothetical protein